MAFQGEDDEREDRRLAGDTGLDDPDHLGHDGPAAWLRYCAADNNRRAKYYRLTKAGRKRLGEAAEEWQETTAIMARFLKAAGESR